MTLWKQRLFARLQRPFDDDGSDLGGEVISVNGESTDTDDESPAGTPEDRGDFLPEDPKPDTAPPADNADAGTEADAGKRTSGIPKARFDEVNEKRKNAEAELALAQAELEKLRNAQATQTTQTTQATTTTQAPADTDTGFDEVAAERQFIEAMMDGDTDKALTVRRQINAHLRESAALEVQANQSRQESANLLERASQTALAAFPYLDTEEGAHALDLIVIARDAAVAKGTPAHLALADAVAKIAPRFEPAGETTPTQGLRAGKPEIDTRTANAIARGAADSLRQSPTTQAGLGNRADAVRLDPSKLDEDQFAQLTTAEKKRLRGD